MGKNSVSSFSYPTDKQPVVDEFDKLALKEGKSRSEYLMNLMEREVKRHGSGNPSFKLDQFEHQEFLALPTAWEDPTPDKLHGISPEEAKFMVGQMSKWYPELQRKVKTG